MVGIKFGELEGMVTVFTGVSVTPYPDPDPNSIQPNSLVIRAHLVEIAFTIAYLLRILHSENPALEANFAFEAIQRALPAMQEVGFDNELVSITAGMI